MNVDEINDANRTSDHTAPAAAPTPAREFEPAQMERKRTAFVLPGIDSTTVRSIRPAVARLSMAAAPTSAKLSMRKISPKPGKVFVSSAEMVSYV